MIDLQYIRDNAEEVAEKTKQKGLYVDIGRLLEFDEKRRSAQLKADELRQKRNELAATGKSQRPTDAQIAEGRELKEAIASLEAVITETEAEFTTLYKQVPNMPMADVPVGLSEDENVVVKQWGELPVFDFEPKNHWEIAESRDLIDKERAARVAGSRFAYVKGGLARMQFAIISWVMDTLMDEAVLTRLIAEQNLNISNKPFVPVLPPAMIKTPVFDAMDRLEPRDDRYRVGEAEDDLWLQGSAEHTLGSMYMDEILPESMFPIRYLGYSSSFRREAGTYGKDSEGIIRMHQFDKLEMEVFSLPDTGYDEHLLLVSIQEYLMQQLKIPYQKLQKCTFDIGKPNARGIDIEAWLPGQNKYRETHTADFMTDYQSRRLKTRVRKADGSVVLVHSNDATAFALGRLLVAIIENYQQADGTIRVPEALLSYMNHTTVI